MLHTPMLKKVLLISLLVLLGTSQAGTVSPGINVWTSIGPEGGIIDTLAIDPTTPATLYAGTDYGVWKTTNGGMNWNTVNSGITYPNVYALAINPSATTSLYAGVLGAGVFHSPNGGGSWSAFNAGLTNIDVYALAIDLLTPATLYVGTGGGGVFKQTVYSPVSVDFSASPTAGLLPLTVAFTNLSTGDFDTCQWDFGDSYTSSLCSPPDHVYLSPSVYTVTLTASGLGGSDTETKIGYITVEKRKLFLPVVTR